MRKVGLWSITHTGPERLQSSAIGLESNLQNSVETDPALLQTGLTIVGREFQVTGGRIDLLGIDPQGRWVVVEFKSGNLDRVTIAQALDYASCISSMRFAELSERVEAYLRARHGTGARPLAALLGERQAGEEPSSESRDVAIFVVGTGLAPGLERMVQFLSTTYNLPISIVLYEVFGISGGDRILARELNDVEVLPEQQPSRVWASIEGILRTAQGHGTKPCFDVLLEAAERHGLYPHPWPKSLMFAPPGNRSRCLFTIWARPSGSGTVSMYVSPKAFADFYPIDEKTAAAVIGDEGYRNMTYEQVVQFAEQMDSLFAAMGEAPQGQDASGPA